MEFRILGPLEVVAEGRSVSLGGTRQRALLAVLLTRANQVVSTERLIDDLWGERPPKEARNTVQYYVSQLRKALGPDTIETRAPGYVIRVEGDRLDLRRFERLVEEGRLREALALWRGPALADFAYEPFAQAEIARLEELRLAVLEERIEADLASGRHAELIGELEALTAQHPLRERLRAQLMLALYRSGRQAEALNVYRETRRTLVEELGIEPSRALQELESSILRQDAALEPAAPERSILMAVRDPSRVDALIALAEPLERELIVCAVVSEPAALARATTLLNERRRPGVRAAAFTSPDPERDLVRFVSDQNVDLLLLDAIADTVLREASCDVGVLLGGRAPRPGPLLVPFGGAEHDWAAVELAAWIAGAHGVALRLAGTPDSSRLLATASLVVQRAVGIATEPVLVPPGPEGIVTAADAAGLVVIGLSDRWRQEGVGETRLEIARRARPPTMLVRKGLRPGGLAPRESLTRFTWSLSPAGR